MSLSISTRLRLIRRAFSRDPSTKLYLGDSFARGVRDALEAGLRDLDKPPKQGHAE